MKKAIATIIACVLLAGCETRDDRAQLYNAWCKLVHRDDITFDEWCRLRDNYLLPGQDTQRAVNAANNAAAISAAAMGMSAARSGSGS